MISPLRTGSQSAPILLSIYGAEQCSGTTGTRAEIGKYSKEIQVRLKMSSEGIQNPGSGLPLHVYFLSLDSFLLLEEILAIHLC